MSDSGDGSTARRPRQVTLAGLMALTGCVLLVFNMLDSMARVRSVDMRNSVDTFLSSPPGSDLGMDVQSVIDLLRGMVFLSGALAAAGAVLAFYTLRRHRGARIGLSVAAVPMLLSSFVSGLLLLPVLVAAAATMLWGREAREWFDGRAPRSGPSPFDQPAPSQPVDEPPPPVEQPTQPVQPVQQPVAQQPPAQQPGPAPYPYGAPPASQPYQQPVQQPYQQPYQQPAQQPGWPYPPYATPPVRPGRPMSVTVAAILTWVFAGLTALCFLLLVITLLADESALLTALQDNRDIANQGYTDQQLLAILWVTSAVSIFWSLAAIVLAVLAFRRVSIARVLLAVSAVISGLVGLLAIVGVLHAVVAFTTVVLLFVGGANRWYSDASPPVEKPPVW